MKNSQFGKRRQEHQEEVKITGPIAGDIIHEKEVEKPTYERVKELLRKRYQIDPLPHNLKHTGVTRPEEHQVEEIVELSLGEDSLQDAIDYCVKHLSKIEGHTRNVILTEEERKKKARTDNVQALTRALNQVLSKPVDEMEIRSAVNRQLSMRKMVLTSLRQQTFENMMAYMTRTKVIIRAPKESKKYILSEMCGISDSHVETMMAGYF